MSAIEAFDYEEPDWAALEEMYEDQLIAECTERANADPTFIDRLERRLNGDRNGAC